MQSFGHGITFGRVCYVGDVGALMLDMINSSGLSTTMTGDGMVAATMEALNEHVDSMWRDADGAALVEPALAGINPRSKICEEFLLKIRRKIEQANETSQAFNHGEPETIEVIIFSV